MALNKISEKIRGYSVWHITQLSDLMKFCEQETRSRDVFFRGQSKDWDLLPKIARPSSRKFIPSVEKKMFDQFVREAQIFLDKTPNNQWDWLAIAQHHGLTTRLLDWTMNPLLALWFSIRKIKTDVEVKPEVWVFQPDSEDIITDVTADEDPFKGERTKVFIPRHVIPRIRAQSGAFTVHKYIDKNKVFIPLQKNIRQRRKLIKIEVSIRHISLIRSELDRCGIHAGIAFPDLDGLSERLCSIFRY